MGSKTDLRIIVNLQCLAEKSVMRDFFGPSIAVGSLILSDVAWVNFMHWKFSSLILLGCYQQCPL